MDKNCSIKQSVKLCYMLTFKALYKPVSPIAILKQITFSEGHAYARFKHSTYLKT